MMKFIELTISDEDEIRKQLVNVDNIGRVFPSPQNDRHSMVELNYHSINDAPVVLEVNLPYETLRSYFLPS
ncbi:MAG TPA: hypothetical protein PKJ63_11780 [Cyclobacteriaceae bacterium]|nr:hypothetical protein [Cyclobacteriaceae bacterium]HRW98155.1 hypothetical protein [Cyclobacteriaceae bacterium]